MRSCVRNPRKNDMKHAELTIFEDAGEGKRHCLVIPAAMSGHTLTDLLARHDFPLNTRCGQRGWCRGCLVELCAGALLDGTGALVAPGGMVRSCQMRVPQGGRVVLKIPERAQIGAVPQVDETFVIDVP